MQEEGPPWCRGTVWSRQRSQRSSSPQPVRAATPSRRPRRRRPHPARLGQRRACRRAHRPPRQDFTGVTVDLLTFNGPQIAEPLQRRAPDFEALTGAKINVVAVGFQEIYDKAILDLSTGTNSFDAFVFNPQWLGDFTGPGYLEDLSARVESDPSSTGRTSGRSSATSTRPTRARPTRSRSTATSTWSITAAT